MNSKTETCPLCGKSNQCAIARGRSGEDCWCQSVSTDTETLKELPLVKNTACLCFSCIPHEKTEL